MCDIHRFFLQRSCDLLKSPFSYLSKLIFPRHDVIIQLQESERAVMQANVEAINMNKSPIFSIGGYSVMELLGSGAFGSVYKVCVAMGGATWVGVATQWGGSGYGWSYLGGCGYAMGRAARYGVGVGMGGATWVGVATRCQVRSGSGYGWS